LPHVTVIRPVKGLEPRLYECLAASLRQTYPKSKIDTVFCVSERSDPAFPILQRLCRDFKDVNVRILVEEEDPMLLKDKNALGPNPKIRNMSRAYREARGDIVWILDCNVWAGKGVCGRLVDLLCGYKDGEHGKKKKYKFVHQTPVAVDMDAQGMTVDERKELLGGRSAEDNDTTNIVASTSSDPRNHSNSILRRIMQNSTTPSTPSPSLPASSAKAQCFAARSSTTSPRRTPHGPRVSISSQTIFAKTTSLATPSGNNPKRSKSRELERVRGMKM
jgi:ceramide glucosyltransferase